ncbi:MAG: gliding motility-associated C-terminal domain-containing protein [Runella sp.]
MKYLILWGLVLGWSIGLRANHFIGGDLSLQKRGSNPGAYTISLTIIYDDLLNTTDEKTFVSVFRKSNHVRIEDFTLTRVALEALPFTNGRCVATPANARITLARYTADVTLSPTLYNAPEGYYLAWEECCRNRNVQNIQNPSRVGIVFYAEIPPVSTVNSSPQFKTPEIRYVCVGKSFEADFGATDADGDQLRYSLVTPLIGSTDGGGTFPAKAQPGPYTRAAWQVGFDSTQAIKGLPSLHINSSTGQIRVKASEIGIFAFAVRCEEWRGGVKIGEVRREFVVRVVDCKSQIPPPAIIEVKQPSPTVTTQIASNGHTQSVGLCRGDSVILKAENESPEWAYEWQRDGQRLSNAQNITLVARQSGNYTLIKRYAQSCGREDSTSAQTSVSLKVSPEVRITSSRRLPLCDNDSTELSINITTKSVEWRRNGQFIENPTIPLTVFVPGVYSVVATDEITRCSAKDSILVRIVPSPPATINIVGTPIFCSNDSTKLTTPKNNRYDYVWFLGDVPLVRAVGHEFYPQKSGKYAVVVVDTATKCSTMSPVIDIVVKTSPVVVFDSIPPLCTSGLQAISLVANPSGGIFEGRGVVGARFVSQNLPAGTYPVSYTYTNAEGCKATAKQNIKISPPPRFELPRELVILRGDSIQIRTSIPQEASISWFPSIGLNNPRSPRPKASPDRTTTYRATLRTPQGCTAESEITIRVIHLVIPNGFTPNGDGFNDTWVIEGIEEYPHCVIEVFNRWGNLVFKSEGYKDPWEGRYNGEWVSVGTYYYQIYLRQFELKLTGSLNILR